MEAHDDGGGGQARHVDGVRFAALLADVGQAAIERDEVADVLVVRVLLPALVELFLFRLVQRLFLYHQLRPHFACIHNTEINCLMESDISTWKNLGARLGVHLAPST